jgi:type I restriction enzyme, S subunit
LENKWQKITLDEICKNISDRIDDPKQADTDYYVGLEHLDSEEIKILRNGTPDDVNATKLKFKKGHILFGKRRWYQRKLAVADRGGICSAHMLVLEPIDTKITPEFLSLFLQGERFFEVALMVSEGSLSPTIKWTNLAKQEFTIPQIPEQKIIVSIITQIDEYVKQTQILIEQAKIYQISKREELLTIGIHHSKPKKIKWHYGKNIGLPENWELKTIDELTETPVTDGPHETPEFLAKGIPFLSVDNIVDNKLDFTELRYISKQDDEKYSKKCKPQRNDILFGKAASVGKVAIVDTDDDFNIWSPLALIRLKKSYVPGYFYNFFQTSFFYNEVIRYTNVNTQGNISMKDIKKIYCLVPTKPEQEAIMIILSEISDFIENLNSYIPKLQLLRKSILNHTISTKIKGLKTIV